MTDPSGPVPWYERYFTADYWTYAGAEYDAERTAAEVRHLAAVLTEYAPGRRVLDLGCGIGRHAVGLARQGFQVAGLDVSQPALDRAALAAADAGVALELHRADLLSGADLPVSGADAAVCLQAFGWGSDRDQLRMLVAVRRALRPGGVLVLDHSNVTAILRNYRTESHAEIDGTTFDFRRRYDASTGRSSGEVLVRRPDGSTAELPDDVRLYQPPEVRDLLLRAGFTVSRVDADFTPGGEVGMDTRYVQFVAVAPAERRSALAGHRTPPPADVLDLRWAPDEVEFVRPALHRALAGIGTELGERTRRYDLADPFGAGLVPALAAHLGGPTDPGRVTLGTGATGLLRDLAGLAVGGHVLTDFAGHPELAVAAVALGVPVEETDLTDPGVALAAVRGLAPAVTVLDRPGVRAEAVAPEQVRALADAVAARGGVLVVDETCAAYLPPAASVVGLVDECPSLVVVRGLAKGYCCGGLRVGFAFAASDVAARVRAVATPLSVAATSADIAGALLRQGDVLGPLRARIAEVKPEFTAALLAAGLLVDPADPRVPWVLLPDDDHTRDVLAQRRLAAKDVPTSGGPALLRLSVPLSADRWRRAAAALAPLAAGSGAGR